ncbi:MAG: D-glycero-beta-D-manno-heptose-7-phosphate kinase [Desulfobacteraceae bacterium]|nr:D-glycero-beta-D-manno-heptose-7-phosphate kinase [Desulfobacteraceae bacterium]
MTLDITKFKKLKVLVLGDLMIDEYVWGSVDRISPEAPVPVVSVNNTSFTLGGAGNVVNNLVSMGANVSVIGTAGTGATGKMLIEKLKEFNVEITGVIKESYRPTTRKTRIIASNQQMLRIDNEVTKEIKSETFCKLKKLLSEKIPLNDLIIISDYAKGLITEKIIKFVVESSKQYNILTIVDPKALDFSKYKNVSMLTPNKKEAGLASNIEIHTIDDLFNAGKKLLNQINLEKLLITCGKEGMVLFEHDKAPFIIESEARQVFDVSGAGDTVISILGLALASGATFKQSALAANAAAAIVVGKVGTATLSIKELSNALNLKFNL